MQLQSFLSSLHTDTTGSTTPPPSTMHTTTRVSSACMPAPTLPVFVSHFLSTFKFNILKLEDLRRFYLNAYESFQFLFQFFYYFNFVHLIFKIRKIVSFFKFKSLKNIWFIIISIFSFMTKEPPLQLKELTEVITKEMVNMRNHDVATNELDRAKKQLKSMLLMNLEARPVLFEDIGRQVLAHGQRMTSQHYCNLIGALCL